MSYNFYTDATRERVIYVFQNDKQSAFISKCWKRLIDCTQLLKQWGIDTETKHFLIEDNKDISQWTAFTYEMPKDEELGFAVFTDEADNFLITDREHLTNEFLDRIKYHWKPSTIYAFYSELRAYEHRINNL